MNEKLSLYELQQVIKESLYISLPDMYWVVAEISEIKENYAGHCYIELIEKPPDDKNIKARIRAVIWSNRYRFLKPYFENTTGESLKEGIKILIKVKVEYHEVYGLSLIISEIDPAFTLGEMALKRQQILRRLEEEGVISMNREIEFPAVPQRIAVISSKNAAGYGDFMNHLRGNNNGYIFYTALFETTMQGSETENGVLSAFDRIATTLELFDVVVIIRGGGSQTDLSWFDNYNIAYYITQFPLPVLTGIGHEKDFSVTDIVAYQALKTPTAVADYLIEKMNLAEIHLNDLSQHIIELSKRSLEKQKQKVEQARMKLIPVAKVLLSEIREQLSLNIIELINFGRGFLAEASVVPADLRARLITAARSLVTREISARTNNISILVKVSNSSIEKKKVIITGFQNSLNILDPVNVLKRGYTITSLDGKILKKSRELKKDDQIDTLFSDGQVKSRIIEKE